MFGCSLAYAERLMASHGYFLLQLDVRDALFVDTRYRKLFGVLPTDLATVYDLGNAERKIDAAAWNPQFVPVSVQKQWRSVDSDAERAAMIDEFMKSEADAIRRELGYDVPFKVEE